MESDMKPDVDLEAEGFSAEEYEEVKLCLETLLSIRAGDQPLDRELGIDFDGIVGFPMNVARNALSLEIMEKVGRYEPRVEVESIEYAKREDYADGTLLPHIHFIRAREE